MADGGGWVAEERGVKIRLWDKGCFRRTDQ